MKMINGRTVKSCKQSNLSCSKPGTSQSNMPARFAKISSVCILANAIPGQPRLPAPKGISSKLFPFMSIVLFRNLSGRNSSGLSHEAGCLCMAHALMITCVPAAMSYLWTLTSLDASRNSKRGAEGCSLAASLITAFSCFMIWGCLSSSDIVHSINVAVGSIPPTSMSCIDCIEL